MAEPTVPHAWKQLGQHARSLQRYARHSGNPVTQNSGSDVMTGWTVGRQHDQRWMARFAGYACHVCFGT